MKRVRVSRRTAGQPGPGLRPGLRVVSRSSPPRPRWVRLYVRLLVLSVLGIVGHVGVAHHRLVDLVLVVVVIATIAHWVYDNRIALRRLDEPAIGVGRPAVRLIRSRRPDADVARPPRPDDERVMLP